MTRGRRRAAGFSLIEMLVALGLAGLVVAGAFQIQGSFARESRRQDEVADVQQTLRLVMTLLERNIRASGVGEQAGFLRLHGCAATQDIYTFQYFNNNSNFPPTPAGYDSTANDADNDPDYFRVIVPIASTNLATQEAAAGLTVKGDLTGWAPGDLISVYKPNPTAPLSCVREITSVNAASGVIGHSSPGSRYPCANPLNEGLCAGAALLAGACCTLTGVTSAPVRRYRDELVFRIIPPVGTSRDAPKLVMMQVPIQQYTGGTWQVVAENIEDMQIALIGKNGSVCNSVDNPAMCNPALAAAVRITLVARTNNSRATESTLGGFEDRPAAAAADNFIRRSVTSEIQLRN
jgi:prepilin-type N-terminal cleavage/methylation domain-containing protein